MKRLCIFYKNAYHWQKKKVQWIVCKECQRAIKKNELVYLLIRAADQTEICQQKLDKRKEL